MKNMNFVWCIALALCVGACAKTANQGVASDEIKMCASDSADVWKPLAETSSVGEVYQFGHTKGRKFSERFSTDSAEVYLEYNVTILEQNPLITRELQSLSEAKLRSWGFIAKNDTVPRYAASDVDATRHSQYDIMRTMIGSAGAAFKANKDSIFALGPDVLDRLSFNAVFDIYPVWLTGEYVTYALRGYAYTSGAHGDEYNQLLTFSLSSGKQLTLTQIVSAKNERKLREMVALHMAGHDDFDNLRTPTVESYLDSLNRWLGHYPTFDGSVNLNGILDVTADNFPLPTPGMTSEGLVFVYPKYMIAPGSAGSPQVVLTWEEVHDLLLPPFNRIKR